MIDLFAARENIIANDFPVRNTGGMIYRESAGSASPLCTTSRMRVDYSDVHP